MVIKNVIRINSWIQQQKIAQRQFEEALSPGYFFVLKKSGRVTRLSLKQGVTPCLKQS